MRPMTAGGLAGTWATVLLPIDEDDRIDWPWLTEQVRLLVAAGVSGVYTNGSSGEFWTQTEDEFDQLTTLVAEVCESAACPSRSAPHTRARRSRSRGYAGRPGTRPARSR